MTEPLTDAELDEMERWTKGYRTLMRGGLGSTVHTAGVGAYSDPNDEDRFPALRVDAVECLVAEVRRLRALLVEANQSYQRLSDLHDFGGDQYR